MCLFIISIHWIVDCVVGGDRDHHYCYNYRLRVEILLYSAHRTTADQSRTSPGQLIPMVDIYELRIRQQIFEVINSNGGGQFLFRRPFTIEREREVFNSSSTAAFVMSTRPRFVCCCFFPQLLSIPGTTLPFLK